MKYVIFTGNIGDMGGAQMYVCNKAKYMKKKGWDVSVFSVASSEIHLDELKKYTGLIIPEMLYLPNCYKKKERESITERLVDLIGEDLDSECIIESNTANLSLWAELLAERINARHFCFLLDEEFSIDKSLLDFFKYKDRRNELAFIREKSYRLLFGEDSVENVSLLKATCNNVTEDISELRFDSIWETQYDWAICSIGRLDKGYIPNVITGLKEFAMNNPDKMMAYIFIGDQSKDHSPNMHDVIDKELNTLLNVCVYDMGYTYPIPNNIFPHIDVGIASSGSCTVFWKNNVTTISIDAKDYEPIGVLGYTTSRTIYRQDEKSLPLSDLLEKILNQDYLKNMKYSECKAKSYDETFEAHMFFIDNMNSCKQYFDVNGIKLKSMHSKMRKLILSVVGFRGYQLLKKIVRK